MPESRATASARPRYWIIKFAPFRTSWSDIVRNGTFTLRGVRSAAARRNLSRMQIDDPVLFYHSQQQQAVIGVMRVSRTAYPDPTSSDPYWLTCDFEPIRTLRRNIPLSRLRENRSLADIALLRQPRLAVSPIASQAFDEILKLAGESI